MSDKKKRTHKKCACLTKSGKNMTHVLFAAGSKCYNCRKILLRSWLFMTSGLHEVFLVRWFTISRNIFFNLPIYFWYSSGVSYSRTNQVQTPVTWEGDRVRSLHLGAFSKSYDCGLAGGDERKVKVCAETDSRTPRNIMLKVQ